MSDESQRRAQILRAAFEEFAAKGFRGATIKSIAQAAHLQSPALIYWYFPTKEALFQAVLGAHLPVLQALIDPGSLLERPPDEVLPLLARAFLATAGQPAFQRMARLIVGEAARRSELAEAIATAGPARVLDFLKTYLARQVELGRLRPHDVRSSARAFLGMLIPHAATVVLFPALGADGLSGEDHLATAIDIFLRGLASNQ